ncbi:MAG: hypothetical protein KF798_01865 [Candidatus Paracaedibacteraceae bacterium]|nr:hypothetical protein [Candidatus Paracaedibacteraceae bacterium]
MLLKTILQKQSKIHNIRWETIEQDYILSWVLEGISAIEELQRRDSFKENLFWGLSFFSRSRF